MIHKDLEVYKSSMALVRDVYLLTKGFPREETYCLAAQMKRAAISVPSNIAEGSGRKSSKELLQFLNIALGSLIELDTQMDIAKMLDFCEDCNTLQEAKKKLLKTKQLLLGLIKSLNNANPTNI